LGHAPDARPLAGRNGLSISGALEGRETGFVESFVVDF
jgi:hypothetical protein